MSCAAFESVGEGGVGSVGSVGGCGETGGLGDGGELKPKAQSLKPKAYPLPQSYH